MIIIIVATKAQMKAIVSRRRRHRPGEIEEGSASRWPVKRASSSSAARWDDGEEARRARRGSVSLAIMDVESGPPEERDPESKAA